MAFNASLFFDLENFSFRELFNDKEPVWEVFKKIKNFLLSQPLGIIKGKVDPRAYLINPHLISIGKGSIVEPGAYIEGPCWIGENCQIRHGAYIRGNFLADDYAVIGHATEVKNSVFLKHASAGHFAYIGDSVLGHHVNLGAGAKCANLRFDRKNICVQKKDTGLRKFGAILGDWSQLGCNAVTNPGTLLYPHSSLAPCLSFGGVVPENFHVKDSSSLIIKPLN